MAVFGSAVFGADAFGSVVDAPAPGGHIVNLVDLWFNDAADPSDAVEVPILRESTISTVVAGEVREYAGGYRRLIQRPGIGRAWTPKLGTVSLEVAQDIVRRAGREQWVRDPVGGRLLGVFHEPTVVLLGKMVSRRWGLTHHASVTLTIREVSSEAA